VAAAALEAGAAVVNDVSGLRLDPGMAELCATTGAGLIIMHSRGTLPDMATYRHAQYGADVAGEVAAELGERLQVARRANIPADAIVVDPGIGFSKRAADSLAILAELPRIVALGYPVLVGVSRKRFIGEITGVSTPRDRLFGTLGANVAALAQGARLFRVHDVRATRDALATAWAVLSRGEART
jgi:dihydropteroate synthase